MGSAASCGRLLRRAARAWLRKADGEEGQQQQQTAAAAILPASSPSFRNPLVLRLPPAWLYDHDSSYDDSDDGAAEAGEVDGRDDKSDR